MLVFLVGYFTYRLIAEPDWLVWSGLLVAAVGILLNLLVIAVNGGQMPAAVEPSSLENGDPYQAITEKTRLRFLADWIDIGPWLISPGDLLLVASVLISLIGLVMPLIT